MIVLGLTAACMTSTQQANAGEASSKGRVVAAAWKSAGSSATISRSTRSSSNSKLKWRQHRAAKKRPSRRDDNVRLARIDAADHSSAVRRAVGYEVDLSRRREATIDEIDPFNEPQIDPPEVTPEPYFEEIGQQPPLELPGDVPSEEMPTLEELAQAPRFDETCPLPSDLKPITDITDDISAEGIEFPPECTLGDLAYLPRQFAMTTYTWKASGLCHKPLYFEQVALERYGHSFGPFVQPLISGAHFFATVPILPYKMGLEPPGECIYALGYHRPGDCAPRVILPLGLSLRGALLQAGAWTGGVFLIP